ncbi:MAG: PGPGW domain-containing protein [Nitrospirae bacterium]|nr:PGPGW domain-containing protein [Nitrospirota bacterium]MBI5056632.1 PGPGW domain-containing protein [Nitrospirota bacterium]
MKPGKKVHPLIATLQQTKRLIRIVVGFTVLAIGIIMIALPGPAIVVIPVGLGILATEFVWARHLLKRFKDGANSIKDAVLNNKPKADN